MALSRCLKLPSSLLVDVLSSWVAMEALVKLDSALMVNRKDRQLFLEILRLPYFCSIGLSNAFVRKAGHSYLLWLVVRCVYVSKLVLSAPQFQIFPSTNATILDGLPTRGILELTIDGSGDVYALVKKVVTHSKCIRKLSFANTSWLTYPRMRAFLKQCSKTLTSLSLNTVKYLSGTHFPRLVPYFNNLVELHLGRFHLNQELLTLLTAHCRNLVHIHFTSCAVHTDSLVRFISGFSTYSTGTVSAHRGVGGGAGGTTTAASCNQLRSIGLVNNTSINMTQVALCIASNCVQLATLTLVGEYDSIQALHTEQVILIASHCTMLQSIDISQNNHITNDAVISISEHCRQLKTLAINACRGITDTAIEHVSHNCAQLEVLDLSWCDNITDTALHHLSSNTSCLCDTLTLLKINGCYRITQLQVVGRLVERCKRLTMNNVQVVYTNLK